MLVCLGRTDNKNKPILAMCPISIALGKVEILYPYVGTLERLIN